MFKLEFTLLFTLLVSSMADANSAEKTGIYGEVKQINTGKGDNGSEETLKKLLTIKGVPEQYEQCQKALSAKGDLEKIPECIWKGHGTIPALNEDTKKQVQQMYAQEENAAKGRSPASASESSSSHLTNKSKHIGEDYMSDPAVVELSKIMKKKLDEALLGDEKAQKEKNTVAVVDHSRFIELYQTELGKTIINAFTSYCIEVDFNKKATSNSLKSCKDGDGNPAPCTLSVLSEESDKKDTIDKNVKGLKDSDLSSSTKTNANSYSDKWTTCIGSVSNVCYTEKNDFSCANGKGSNCSDDQINRSRTQACAIMDYVKSARKNLIIAEDQKKYFDSLGKSVSMEAKNFRGVDNTGKNSNDAVTTITSKNIEDSYKTKSDELKEEMKKCLDDNNGKIIDEQACKKFISTDTDAKNKELAEFGVRQFALEEKIKEKLNDKKEVEKYLQEEGYDKDKISKIIGSENDLKIVKEEIADRYRSERDAIIASMAKKIESQSTEKNGKIDTTPQSEDQKRLSNIKNELSTRTSDLKNLVHFNNIVSSYLEIDHKGKKSRNVASLFAELEDGDKSSDEIRKIKENAEKAGLKHDKKSAGTNLGVETLNGIFKYSTEK